MPETTEKVDYKLRYETGIQTFAKLFRLWMDNNGWSHPVMTSLFKASLDGCGWLHSSQISGFRHARTKNPGPRAFVAIERLNFYLHRYDTSRRLIPNTRNSNDYSQPFVILEDNRPPEPGWWFEVFCGVRNPKEYLLDGPLFSEPEAEQLTRSLARFFRRQMSLAGYDPIEDTSRLLRECYPIRDTTRVAIFMDILKNGSKTWTADQLQDEIAALTQLSAALGGPSNDEELLDHIRQNP